MHYTVLTAPRFPYAADIVNANLLNIPSPVTPIALSRIQGDFERVMTEIIDATMEPYDEATENLAYLEFENMDDEVHSNYKAMRVDCVQMTNGSIYLCWDQHTAKQFTVEDGVVYERNWGRLHHNKRSKRAKQIKFLPNFLINRIYKTLESFAEDYHGYSFNQEHQAFGYMTNSNSYYDWYQIGGRWPQEFLIHSDDPFFIMGEKSWCNESETKKAPQGHRWVTGARKSAIKWDKMKEIAVEEATACFKKLEQWFATGTAPDDKSFGRVTEKGIEGWGGLLYEKGMPLGQYLTARGLAPEQRMLPSTYYILQHGEWVCADSYNKKEDETAKGRDWSQVIADYYDALPDDAILVMLDCHQ